MPQYSLKNITEAVTKRNSLVGAKGTMTVDSVMSYIKQAMEIGPNLPIMMGGIVIIPFPEFNLIWAFVDTHLDIEGDQFLDLQDYKQTLH